MKLDEVGLDAVERRVKQLRTNTKATRGRARQLKAQANMNPERLQLQKSGAALTPA